VAVALIKVGMPISYDYKYLYHSLPLLYEHADRITLAVDKDYRTWTGIPFTIEDSFWNWLKQIDTHKKIRIYRDDFFVPDLSPMENQTRERNLLAQYMGPGGWHIQVDSDEYFIDFEAFVRFLHRHSRLVIRGHPKMDIGAFLIPMYKQIPGGYLYVPDTYETFILATNKPDYVFARKCGYPVLYSNTLLFHQTWARTPQEVLQKVSSIGARTEFDTAKYYHLWQSIDAHNYPSIRNFHPLLPHVWPRLEKGDGGNVADFISTYCMNHCPVVPLRVYWRRRLGQMKKSVLHKLRVRHSSA